MIPRTFLLASALSTMAHADPVKSGHASAEWISAATTVEGGKPIRTGIRVIVEEGWHSYWINPGDSGMALKVVWELPDGWTAGVVRHPVPKKFMTGELPGYGYEGEVIFPVTIMPPAGADGSAKLAATVSWLTCNDSSCIPGKVKLELTPASGNQAQADAISESDALVPKPLEGAKLEVVDQKENVTLALALPESSAIDLAGWEVFPATEMAVDHLKPIRFTEDGGKWTATVAKNQYADPTLSELRLVFAKKGEAPLSVSWNAR